MILKDRSQENSINPDNPRDVIKLSDVTFSYNHNPVLKNVDMSVKAGDFIAIVGPNGSAKSTLLKIMIGQLSPKDGQVTIFGQKVGLYRDWNKIGYVSQQAGNINTSFPATVYEVVSSGYYSGFGRIFDGRERKRAVERALKTVDVMELSGRLIGELSGGQRQKVFLAKALVKNPEVLLLDEPTTGIDARSQEEFYRLLAKLNQRDNMTIVMVTHDLDEALEKVNKIGYIKDQKVILQIKARDFSKKDLREVFG